VCVRAHEHAYVSSCTCVCARAHACSLARVFYALLNEIIHHIRHTESSTPPHQTPWSQRKKPALPTNSSSSCAFTSSSSLCVSMSSWTLLNEVLLHIKCRGCRERHRTAAAHVRHSVHFELSNRLGARELDLDRKEDIRIHVRHLEFQRTARV